MVRARKTSALVLARVVAQVAHKVEEAHPRRRAGSMALARDGSRRVLVHRRRVVDLDRLSRLRLDRQRTLVTRKARRTLHFTRMAPLHSREGRGIGSEARARVVLLRYLTCRLEALFILSSLSLVASCLISYVPFFLSSFFISLSPLNLSYVFCHSHLVRLSSITLCKIESLCGLRQSNSGVSKLLLRVGRSTGTQSGLHEKIRGAKA